MAHQEQLATTYQVKVFANKPIPESFTNFVLAKWMKSFRYGNDYIKLSDSDSYYAAYERYIRSILESPFTTTRLAVLTDEPDAALGFSVSSGKTLHYVYVGLDYRCQGIGTRLVPFNVEEFTHLTKKGMKLWATKAPKAIFNPWL